MPQRLSTRLALVLVLACLPRLLIAAVDTREIVPTASGQPDTAILPYLLERLDALERFQQGNPDAKLTSKDLLDTPANQSLSLANANPIEARRLQAALARSMQKTGLSERQINLKISGDLEPLANDPSLPAETRMRAAELAIARVLLAIKAAPSSSMTTWRNAQDSANAALAAQRLRQREADQLAFEMQQQQAAQEAELQKFSAWLDPLRTRLQATIQAQEAMHSAEAALQIRNQGRLQDYLLHSSRLIKAINELDPDSTSGPRLYDETVELLKKMRAHLDAELLSYEELQPPTMIELPIDELPPPSEAAAREIDELRNLSSSHNINSKNRELSSRNTRKKHIRDVIQLERNLNNARISLLEKLPDDIRQSYLGFGSKGRAQFWRELHHVSLMMSWQRLGGMEELASWWSDLRQSPSAILVALMRMLALVGLIVVSYRFKARHASLLRTLETRLTSLLRTPSFARRCRRARRTIQPVAPLLAGLLATSIGFHFILAPYQPVLKPVYYALMAYLVYQIFITSLYHLFRRAVHNEADHPEDHRSELALRSARLSGRFMIISILLLSVSEAFMGKGYLYHIILQFVQVLWIPVLLVLMQWWRDDVVKAYLSRHPEGELASLVDRTRTHWYGFFMALAALGVLSAISFTASLQRFILGFENTRKALAYLFRKRLEKRSSLLAEAESASRLPDDILSCLSMNPVDRDDLLMDYYPGIDDLLPAIDAWTAGKGGNAWLLTGRSGIGKSQWLASAEQRIIARGLSTASGRLPLRLTDWSQARPVIEALLPADAAPGQRRIILLDDVQNLVLREVGTMGSWYELMALIDSTRDRCFWLLSCTHYTHEFLRWSLKDDFFFSRVQQLRSWPEEKIGELLRCRTHAAGLVVQYDDLLHDRRDSAYAATELLSTERDYNRLIWDYSMGLPRSALDAWRDSLLLVDTKKARIRLFRAVPDNTLDLLTETERFVLASLLWHGGISTDHAARSLQIDEKLVRRAMQRLQELDIVESTPPQFRISTWWQAAVTRHLRRQHLVES